MRLRELDYTVETPYVFAKYAYWVPGRVLVVDGKRVNVSGHGRPDVIKVFRDLDDKGTLLVLTVDNRYESVGLGVYHVDATHELATRADHYDEWEGTEFLEPLREEFLSQLNGDHDRFVDILGRTPADTFRASVGLTLVTMARRLKRYIDETS